MHLQHAYYHRMVEGSEFLLRFGDIVQVEMDAIVTAANSRLAGGGGVDGAVHRSGGPMIMSQCRQLKGCPTGKAVVTGAGNLKAKIVIHAVGPVWSGGHKGEAELLRSVYRESLLQAVKHSARSVIFPSISTGSYGYPIAEAAPIAVQAVVDFLRQSDQIDAAGFILFTKEDLDVYQEAARQIIDESFLGCYARFFKEILLYAHPLHFNGIGDHRSLLCRHLLASLSDELHWEEDTIRLIGGPDWRDHLSAAVSFYLCPHHHDHPPILTALWGALERGSWVSPQLLVVLSQRDPDFSAKLERLLTRGVRPKSAGHPMLDHVVQGPGNDDSRLGKVANAALGLAAEGLWRSSREVETRARELAVHDYDQADEIAASWFQSLQRFAQA